MFSDKTFCRKILRTLLYKFCSFRTSHLHSEANLSCMEFALSRELRRLEIENNEENINSPFQYKKLLKPAGYNYLLRLFFIHKSL